jgi:hypothetical protein
LLAALACAMPAAACATPAAARMMPSAARASASAATPPRPCPPRGQVVIAEDAAMRVYRPKLTALDETEQPVVACLLRSRIRMTLSRGGPPGMLVIEGSVAAYVTSRRTGVDTSISKLVVVNVARRAVLREAPAGRAVDAGFVFSEAVSDLAVTAQGAVAWIVSHSGFAGSGAVVMAAPPTGPAVVLDHGAGVEPQSMYIGGGEVHWVDGGANRAAPLPPAP